ncbi:MAG: hypothetical protein R3236_02810, partial [Phycisphaeraceae bacterium]|nr:hypothetical protein [Phycisphaeraceae bacterium]
FEQRLGNIGVSLDQIDKPTLIRPVETSWYEQIGGAEAIEKRLWDEYEQQFKRLHEEALAYRLTPTEAWEIDLVRQYFPDTHIEGKEGRWLKLDHRQIHYSKWKRPVPFDEIAECNLEEAMSGNRLLIKLKNADSVKLPVASFHRPEAELIEMFERYYSRALTSAEHRRQQAEQEADQAG